MRCRANMMSNNWFTSLLYRPVGPQRRKDTKSTKKNMNILHVILTLVFFAALWQTQVWQRRKGPKGTTNFSIAFLRATYFLRAFVAKRKKLFLHSFAQLIAS